MEYFKIKVNAVQLGLLMSMILEKLYNFPTYQKQLKPVFDQLELLYQNSLNDCGCSEWDTENQKNRKSNNSSPTKALVNDLKKLPEFGIEDPK